MYKICLYVNIYILDLCVIFVRARALFHFVTTTEHKFSFSHFIFQLVTLAYIRSFWCSRKPLLISRDLARISCLSVSSHVFVTYFVGKMKAEIKNKAKYTDIPVAY